MRNYSLSHVSDAVLLRDLAELIARDRLTTAEILVHIAEVDARRLYAPAGYSSMHAYCVGELKLSEDAAFRRIRAARAAKTFPALYEALTDGKLHLAAVSLLAPHMTEENAEQLIEVSSGKRKAEIEEYLAWRFESVKQQPVIRALSPVAGQLVPGRVGTDEEAPALASGQDGKANDVSKLVPGRVDAPKQTERYLLQVTIGRSTRAKLRHAQALLSHAIPSGDLDQVLDRALDALIQQVEKRKVGLTTRQRHSRASARKRHVASHVRRAVWNRDGGQCTFVSAEGKRCGERRFLEFDHVEPVALGGQATVQNIRLRCRTHNLHEAERRFGIGFMSRKRDELRVPPSAKQDQTRDVLAGLRNLGCRPGDARRAADYSAALPVVSLEERMRAALQFLGASVATKRPRTAS